jgi:hypothetical protein
MHRLAAILGDLVARARLRVAVTALVLLALPTCGVHGLSFVQDKRVDILQPHERSQVRVPFTVDWKVKDFAVGPGQGSFGIFIDREPTRSGKTLEWVFRGDDSCRGSTGKELCRTTDFLAQRNVFRTTDTSFTVEQVPRLTGNERRRQFHEVTVVLLDPTGRRVGEGAWSRQVEVKGKR